MKIQMRTGKFIMGVTAVFVLAIATTASAQNPKAVTLNIVDNTLVMETKHNENGCKWTIFETRRDGCIGLGKNEKSEIDFKLKDRKCTLKPGPDREWKLNAVYLGGFNATEPPKEDGYGFSSTPDPDYDKVKSDFTILDRSTGLVKLVKNTDTKLTINDKNEHKYNVWYKIEATCEREGGGDPHVTSYDPRVKNEG